MVKLIASSVVRGAQQGQSHGGVYLIDFKTQRSIKLLIGIPQVLIGKDEVGIED